MQVLSTVDVYCKPFVCREFSWHDTVWLSCVERASLDRTNQYREFVVARSPSESLDTILSTASNCEHFRYQTNYVYSVV